MGRRTRRYIFFFFAIAIGVAIGVLLGWAYNPLNTSNSGLESLRVDYKTDTILMIAKLYQSDGELDATLGRLSSLGDDDPSDLLQIAINYAAQHAYASADIAVMQALADDIAGLSSQPE